MRRRGTTQLRKGLVVEPKARFYVHWFEMLRPGESGEVLVERGSTRKM